MRPGVRTRLFIVSLLLIALVGAPITIHMENRLRNWLTNKIKQNIHNAAAATREGLMLSKASAQSKETQSIIRRFSIAMDCRLMLFSKDHKLVADSAKLPNQPTEEEDIPDNLPVIEKLTENNTTILGYRPRKGAPDVLYAARLLKYSPTETYIVVSLVSLEEVDHLAQQLRVFLLIAGALALGLAVIMSWLASHMLSRALGRLVDNARVLVSGQGNRIDIFSSDEIGRLAGSFNLLTAELETTMGTLAHERARFEAILKSMSEAVLVLDDEQVITLVNPSTLRLLNIKDDPINKPMLEAIHAPGLYEIARQGIDEPAQIEFSISTTKECKVLARATPLSASSGAVIVMHDVTEIRRLENIRKDFVANVSHELRTPVSIIKANAETLLDGAMEDPVRGKNFVEALYRNADRLSRIISDLLDLSRLEAGRYSFEITVVDVSDAVSRAVEAVNEKALSRRQNIEVSVYHGQEVLADAKALEQVLLNLLENSIKYTPEGGNIAVRAEERADEVRIEVQDDGPGIKADHRARIFERFYRIDSGRSRDMGGTGLGLAIVKHFVESMRGKAGVDPAFPRGSIFWITLPYPEVPDDDSDLLSVHPNSPNFGWN